MATVEEVARSALAAIDSDVDIVLASKWVASRFRQVASIARLRGLRKIGVANIAARLGSGDVAVTNGSTTVTGDATAIATWGPEIVGRSIKIESVWYDIEAYSSPNITLSSAYSETTSAATGYDLVQRYVTLPNEVKHIGSVVHMRLSRQLARASLAELDSGSPRREHISTPTCFSEATPHLSTEQKRIEFYPYCDDNESIHYVFWDVPESLGLHDTIPGDVEPMTLREGVLVDLYRFEAARAAKLGNVELASYWRNESRAQNTQWMTKDIYDAVRSDTGSDDIMFVAESSGRSAAGFDVMSARQQVWLGY